METIFEDEEGRRFLQREAIIDETKTFYIAFLGLF